MKAMETNEPNEWRVDFKELAVHTQKHHAGYAVGSRYKKKLHTLRPHVICYLARTQMHSECAGFIVNRECRSLNT